MDTWRRRIHDLHVWMEVGLPSGDGGMSSFIFISHIGRGECLESSQFGTSVW